MGTIEGTIGQLFPEADIVPAAGVSSGSGGVLGNLESMFNTVAADNPASSGSGADTGLPGEMHMFEYMFASLTQSLQQLLVQNTSSQSGASGANTLPATAS